MARRTRVFIDKYVYLFLIYMYMMAREFLSINRVFIFEIIYSVSKYSINNVNYMLNARIHL